MANLPNKYIAIDEEGYPILAEKRLTDAETVRTLLQNITFAENGSFKTTFGSEEALVEAFDEPIIARHVALLPPDGKTVRLEIVAPFETRFVFRLESLSLDQWDRFHGFTEAGIPFVFSRAAQAEFFNLCDDYDDDSITVRGKLHRLKNWLSVEAPVAQADYWQKRYENQEDPWDLGEPAPALKDILPRLKLPKSRVLVLGCGPGHDANFFAEHGHVVTAVDFSAAALEKAKKNYSTVSNINWVQADALHLPSEYEESFDIVVEHTCFCAIPPENRDDLIKAWRRCLIPGGHLLAVLFTMERKGQPPLGGSEWEYRERLKKHFQFLFWGRWRHSIKRRQGQELLIYAMKR